MSLALQTIQVRVWSIKSMQVVRNIVKAPQKVQTLTSAHNISPASSNTPLDQILIVSEIPWQNIICYFQQIHNQGYTFNES